MEIKELAQLGDAEGDRLAQAAVAVPRSALRDFKVKAQAQEQYDLIWSSRGAGARTDCSVWAPRLAVGFTRNNRVRLCLGHYVVAHGAKDPKQAGGAC